MSQKLWNILHIGCGGDYTAYVFVKTCKMQTRVWMMYHEDCILFFLIPIFKVQILGKCNRAQDPVSSSDIKRKIQND